MAGSFFFRSKSRIFRYPIQFFYESAVQIVKQDLQYSEKTIIVSKINV